MELITMKYMRRLLTGYEKCIEFLLALAWRSLIASPAKKKKPGR